jgi:hypothetical protein
VQVFFWLSLGVLVVAIVAGGTFVGVRAWRAWVVFTSFAAGGAAGMEALAVRVADTTEKAERATAKITELEAAVTRLQHATRQVRVLANALAEVYQAVHLVRMFLPV